ncbi:MAG: molybdopterin molybdotransferase MoeA [Prosthecochloris sp.]|jgi:molybdopterin molybdotransferase|nr:molybdopterin molybdotransferase MoeA [Prosthecochloris sp.]
MITVEEASRIIAASVHPLPAEMVCLGELHGRVLADDILAGFSLPRFDNAAMDGFAVRWDDIRSASDDHPVRLDVNQEIAAGASPLCPVRPGTCAQIMTGAPMPEGADTVVIFEHTSGFGKGSVEVYKAPGRNANVRYAGEEVVRGEVVLRRGERLTTAGIGVLAAFGYAEAPVFRRPRIALVTVGDELREPGQSLDGASIYNSNRYSLEAAALSAGAELSVHREVPDDPEVISEALRSSLDRCDVLVTSGGISTGEYDYIQQRLLDLGVKERFWKVAQKPGKPFFFGDTPDRKLVFGLPGNPVSALVCFLEYVMPALSALQKSPYHGKIRAVLAEPFPADRKRYRFLFGKVWQEDGTLRCRVSEKTESHMITSLVGANCLIEAPAAPGEHPAGSVVTCNLLPWSALHE